MAEQKSLFGESSAAAKTLIGWHASLENNKGHRARLRRAKSPNEVALLQPFHQLLSDLDATGENVDCEPMSFVAGLLAHVDRHVGGATLPQQMAAPKGNNPVVSPLRFRRLLEHRVLDEKFYAAMIRILRILDGKVNLYDLARDLYYWQISHQYWNDRLRKQWAYHYYANAPKENKGV